MHPLQPNDFLFQLPLLVLSVFGMILVLGEAFARSRRHDFLMHMAVAGCVLTIIAAIWVWKALPAAGGSVPMLHGMLVADRFSMFLIILFATSAGLTMMTMPAHQRAYAWDVGESYGLVLLSVAGMSMLALAGDLVTIFIGIELMSLGVYALTAARWRDRQGAEAAMKYFLMGAFATGFLVYGIALIYGSTGATNLSSIAAHADPSDPLLIIGIFMMLIAFAFKIAAVPFHMWAPDAYEGAPTPVTGFMAAAVKAAAFTAVLRVITQTLGGDVLPVGRLGWGGILAVLAALTMTVGNIAALRQENIKRMLAYSSVSHAGVILVGVVATGLVSANEAQPAVLFYLLSYAMTTVGAFAVLTYIGAREGKERVLVSDWNGLATSRPGAALAMTIFMLSLGGVPPTAGFFAKFYIFKSAMLTAHTEMEWLVIIGVLNSVVSIFYYLRVVTAMYFKEPEGEFKPLRSGAVTLVLVVCALAVLEIGILPGTWLSYAGG